MFPQVGRNRRIDQVATDLAERNVAALDPRHRVLVVALLAAAVSAMVTAGASFGGIPLLDEERSAERHAAAGLLVFAGLVLSLGVLAESIRATTVDRGISGYATRIGERALPVVGLVLYAVAALAMENGMRTAQGSLWTLFRTTVWVGLAISFVYVLGPRRTTTPSFTVAFPAMCLLISLAVLRASNAGPQNISALLTWPLVILALCGIAPILVGVVLSGALRGLAATRARGETVAKRAEKTSWLLVVVIVAKLAVIATITVLHWRLRPDFKLPSPSDFVLAAVVASAVMVLLIVNGRIQLSIASHGTATQWVTTAFAGSVGVTLVLLTTASLLLLFAVVRPLSLVAVVLFAGLGVAAARAVSRRSLVGGYLLAAVLGAVTATTLAAHQTGITLRFDDPTFVLVGTSILGLLFLCTIVALFIVTLVLVIKNRRREWLVYIGAIAVWFTLVEAWRALGTTNDLAFDLALTSMLGVAAVLYAKGVQESVDPFEIVVVISALFLLVDYPGLMKFAAVPLPATPLLLLAVLGPGVAALRSGLADVNRADSRRRGLTRLATTSFLYLALCALIWLTDFDAAAAKSTLDGVAADAKPLVMPVALLLVAAHRQVGKQEDRDL